MCKKIIRIENERIEQLKKKYPEIGKKKLVVASIIDRATKEENEKMKAAYYDSNNEIGIELRNLQANQRDLAIAFARKLDSIPDSDISRILSILNKEKK